MFDVKQDSRRLLDRLGQTAMSNTAYDTAWVARVPSNNGPRTPAFPETLEWLRRNQYPNGSWGGSVEYYHDRVISTLAAILALTERGDPAQNAAAIQRGERYIRENMQGLYNDAFETVGFELIFPTLLAKARQLDLDLPDFSGSRYERIRKEKLKRIPPELIYSRQITTAHSLEFMGSELDVDRTTALQEENGSFGNSPSATAYFLAEHGDDPAARRYLAETIKVGAGAARPLHPVEIFNMSWVLYNLDLAGLLDELEEQTRPHLEYLYQAWNPERGVGFSRQYSVPDLDDTAVVFKLLRQAGYDVHPEVFAPYEREKHFICFPYERNPSVGVHVHLLDALRLCPDYAGQARMVEKVLAFYRTKVRNAYWLDKWHISPYYILSHAAIALIGFDDELAREKIDCILSTQRPDGTWGYFEPTAEETAYCLQALMVYHRQVSSIDSAVTYHAAQYLYDQYPTKNYPALWIDKCLYCPLQVVRSAILSALWMYETR